MMFGGFLLLKKPDGWVESKSKSEFKPLLVLKNKTFIGIWIMFYINIACGLALISQEKNILHDVGFASVGVICSFTALFNAGGRLGFSALADKLKDRNTIYKVIFTLSIIFTAIVIATKGIENKSIVLVVALLFMINAGYGGGFSNLPTLLSDHFGMKTISTIHGLALSAWAIAGLTGNQLSALIYSKTGSYESVLNVTVLLYCVALASSMLLIKKGHKAE